jgi:hypothetical protein
MRADRKQHKSQISSTPSHAPHPPPDKDSVADALHVCVRCDGILAGASYALAALLAGNTHDCMFRYAYFLNNIYIAAAAVEHLATSSALPFVCLYYDAVLV